MQRACPCSLRAEPLLSVMRETRPTDCFSARNAPTLLKIPEVARRWEACDLGFSIGAVLRCRLDSSSGDAFSARSDAFRWKAGIGGVETERGSVLEDAFEPIRGTRSNPIVESAPKKRRRTRRGSEFGALLFQEMIGPVGAYSLPSQQYVQIFSGSMPMASFMPSRD